SLDGTPGEQTRFATVDLLPCRPNALETLGGDRPIHVLPLQLQVTTGLGTRQWGELWKIPVDLLEAESAQGFAHLSVVGGLIPARKAFELHITSDLPLVAPPSVTFDPATLESEGSSSFLVRQEGT